MTQANQYGKKNGDRLRNLYDINIYPITNVNYDEYCKMIEKANDIIRKKQNIVDMIDLERFAQNKDLLYDQVHYTNEGSEVIADYIFEQIKRILVK